MTRPHPIERDAINDAALLSEIAKRYGAGVLANLDDSLPGFPASASAGSGSTIGSRDVHSPVESLLIGPITRDESPDDARQRVPDAALVDLARLEEIRKQRQRLIREEFEITSRWLQRTATAQAKRDARPSSSDDWCESCERVHRHSPVRRRRLCGWCDDFKAIEGVLPPLDLLEAHHRGVRMNQTMIRQALARVKGKK